MAVSTTKKRNQLSLKKKYELVKVAEKKTKVGEGGSKKTIEYFKCGKTQVCSILKNQGIIVEKYE